MPDDALLARIEERLEMFRKHIQERLDSHEDLDDQRFGQLTLGIREEFESFEKLMREAIGSAVQAIDAKNAAERALNTLMRAMIYAACGAILLFFLNNILGGWGLRALPEKPPAHSTQEMRQK